MCWWSRSCPRAAPSCQQPHRRSTSGSIRSRSAPPCRRISKLSQAESEPSNSRLGRKLQRLQLHRIAAEDYVDGLSGSSFTDTDWALLLYLRDQGRAAAEAWLVNQAEHEAAAKIA